MKYLRIFIKVKIMVMFYENALRILFSLTHFIKRKLYCNKTIYKAKKIFINILFLRMWILRSFSVCCWDAYYLEFSNQMEKRQMFLWSFLFCIKFFLIWIGYHWIGQKEEISSDPMRPDANSTFLISSRGRHFSLLKT